jgi:PAS domain S-box-containing protein
MMRTPASAGAVGIMDRASDRAVAAAARASAAMPAAAVADHAFLFAPAADRRKYQIPLAVVLLSLLVFLAVVPFARMRLPHAWAIMPSYESALVVNNLITAVLLFAQFAILRSRALLALACGYLFAALMIVPHTLTFPGVLGPDGLLGSAPQSTAWLYLFWHAGLPLAVIAYALLGHETGAQPLAQASIRPAIVLGVIAVVAIACALTLLATAGQALLPALVRSNGYTPAMLAAGATVAMSGLAALMALWMRRPRFVLDLWLMAVMCVWLLDVALSTLLNTALFDVGFYAGRIYALVAACILLPVLLLESGVIYAQLDRPVDTDRGEGERRPGEPSVKSRGEGLGRVEEIFRLAVDACPGGIVMIDAGGKIAVVNAEAEQMFGYRSNELIGRSVDMLVPERLRPQYVRLLQQLDIGSDGRRIALRRDLFGLRKDGSEFPAEVGLNPLRTREGPMVLGVVVDISERLQMERLKDEFVSTVSHELRTPLTSIAASLGLLSGGAHIELPATAKRLITIAHSNSERLVRLINDILDIEKIESGNVSFDLERVEVGTLVAQTIEANRALAESCGVRLRLDEAGTHEVRADPDRLMQVVTNLLSNAIRFSPRGAEVIVSIASCNDKVRISVRDHGPGIPESFRPHVFEKFAQADAGAARSKGGSGLGLSIVKQIVLRLEGEVGFLDAPGGGTTFYVELPGLASEAGGRRGNGSDVRAHSASEDARERAVRDPERLRLAAGALRAFARTGTA